MGQGFKSLQARQYGGCSSAVERQIVALDVVGSNPITHPIFPLGYRQAVRHGTLTPAFVGSNPATPASFSTTDIRVRELLMSVLFIRFFGNNNENPFPVLKCWAPIKSGNVKKVILNTGEGPFLRFFVGAQNDTVG